MAIPPVPVRSPMIQGGYRVSESWRVWFTRVQAALAGTADTAAFLVEHTTAGAHGAITAASATIGTLHATTFTADSFVASGAGLPARGAATDLVWVSSGVLSKGTLLASDIPSLSESQITDGALLARVAGAETITGAWAFGTLPVLPVQSASRVWAGPASGSAAAPTFRALVDADVPNILTLTDVLGLSTGFAGDVRLAGTLSVHGGAIDALAPLSVRPTGDLTLAPTGSVVFAPDSGRALPETAYGVALGSHAAKFHSLWAGELWVETLVAQETVATIGGRIVVCPTTALVSDLAAGATSITVKHNSLADGDVLYLESGGKVEFLLVTSAATGSGGAWTSDVQRDLSGGPGSIDWAAGDAVVNTGQIGAGFIDIYSLRGLKSELEAGPTIVGNVRTASGTTSTDPLVNQYAAWEPRWAIGNLNGLYGYGSAIYGVAMGDAAAAHVLIDATNGVRIRHGSTNAVEIQPDGDILFSGDLSSPHFSTDATGTTIPLATAAGFDWPSAYGFSGSAITTGSEIGLAGWEASGARTVAVENRSTSAATTYSLTVDVKAEAGASQEYYAHLNLVATTTAASEPGAAMLTASDMVSLTTATGPSLVLAELNSVATLTADAIALVGPVEVSGYVGFTEMSEPAAGGGDTARLYCKDDGSGKSQLCVRFTSGAVQVLATEP